jgi:hypothetical protein
VNQKSELSLPSTSAGFLIGLLFDPEERGDVFFRKKSDFQQTTRRYIPEDRIHNYHCENLISYSKEHPLTFLKHFISAA